MVLHQKRRSSPPAGAWAGSYPQTLPQLIPARDGHRKYGKLPEWEQDSSPAESDERLYWLWVRSSANTLLDIILYLSALTSSENGSPSQSQWFSIYLVCTLGGITKKPSPPPPPPPPLFENTFNPFLFLEEKRRKKDVFLQWKESASHPSSCASA